VIKACFLMLVACFKYILYAGKPRTGNEPGAVKKGIKENLTYPKGSQRSP
jgi:hypothetical protein